MDKIWMICFVMILSAQAALGAGPNVSIGSNKELIVNGETFFPIFSWSNTIDELDDMEADGLNMGMGIAKRDEDNARGYFDKLEELDMYGVVDGRTGRGYIQELVDDPRAMAWLAAHEQDMDKQPERIQPRSFPREIQEDIDEFFQVDSSRPSINLLTARFLSTRTYINWNQWMNGTYDMYYDYADVGDILVYDFYPVQIWGTSTDRIVDIADATNELRYLYGEDEKPVWAIVEADAASGITPVQVRNEVWSAIINGATGIGYWGYNSGFTYTWVINNDVKDLLRDMNPRIQRLKEVIFADPWDGVSIETQNGYRIDYTSRLANNSVYIFAVNLDMDRNPETVEFTVAGASNNSYITVLGEDRTLAAQEGIFSDDFDALEVHLYQIVEGDLDCVTDQILASYIASWKQGDFGMDELIDIILQWKDGCS